MKYRISSRTALSALGFGAGDVASVPAPLLAAFPTGADLDPAAASGAAKPKVTAPACASSEAKGDDTVDGADEAGTTGAAR